MKIGKYFEWDMGHRLIHHKGKCFNIHGHRYKLYVEVKGPRQKNGMVMDFADLKNIVQPLIESMDHTFMCYNKDTIMKPFLEQTKFKVLSVDFETTAENIAFWLYTQLKKEGINITTIKLWETPTSVVEYRGDYA